MPDDKHIRYILEGEDKASGVFGKLAGNIKNAGAIIVGAGAAAGGAIIGLGKQLFELAASAEPLIGVKRAFQDLTADVVGGSDAMLRSLVDASHGWVTNADLMMSFNQASSLVGDWFAQKLPTAMGYLSKVASSTGMDMNYMLDSLVRGVGRLSPLILDNLGIQATLGEAVEVASEMFGKEADQLSKAEQQAGMFNLIMGKLEENTKDIQLPEKSFESFKIKLENLHHEIGEKLVPILSPFIDMLSKVAGAIGEKLTKALDKLAPIIEPIVKAISNFFGKLAEGEDPLAAVHDLIFEVAKALGIQGEAFANLYKTAGDIVGFFQGLGEAAKIFKWAISGDELLDWNEAGKHAPDWLRDVTYWVSNLALDIKELIKPIVDWVKENVKLKDVLMAVGLAVAAFVLPILASIITTLAPIILTFLALVGVIALVRKAWENDWGGIRTKLTEAWENTIRPALESLWAWLREKIPEAIAALRDFWENTLLPALQTVWQFIQDNVIPILEAVFNWLKERIPEAIQAAKDRWENVLKPALELVWQFIVENVIPILSAVYNWLKEKIPVAIQAAKDFWENKLKPALETVWQFIVENVIPILVSVYNWLKEKIPEAVAKVKDFWENKLKPALETVWQFIQEKVIPILSDIRNWLADKVKTATETLSDLWENTLKPALQTVWQFIQEHVLPLLKSLWEFIDASLNVALDILAGLWKNVLKPALEKVWEVIDTKILPAIKSVWEWIKDKLTPVIQPAQRAFDRLKGALDKVGDVLDWVKGLIDSVTSALKNIHLPDWLQGHSPSPFENTLAGVHKHLMQVNRDLIETQDRFNALGRNEMAPAMLTSYQPAPAFGAGEAAGGINSRNYNLTIITSGDPGRLEDEFGLMESWAGV